MIERNFLGFDIGAQTWIIGTFNENDRTDMASKVRKLPEAEILAKKDFGIELNQKVEYEIILNDKGNEPIKLIEYPNGRLDRPCVKYNRIS